MIIDYKGGGMANLLEPLPHVVGKITNIGSDITRSLLSLKSESIRRQKIFEKVGANHIDKYQKMYREGKVSEPMPHLIIVSDEFAELKKPNRILWRDWFQWQEWEEVWVYILFWLHRSREVSLTIRYPATQISACV